jgi:hypothetical protein
MATLCERYASESAARQAAEALRASGVPGRDIRLVTGCRRHDIREEPVGGWAGPVPPDAPVGSFGNVPGPRSQAAGCWAGDPDRQRQGFFGDIDRELILDYENDGVRAHVVGDLALRRFLRDARVRDVPPREVIAELHDGHAIVLADIAEISPGDATAQLKKLADAA